MCVCEREKQRVRWEFKSLITTAYHKPISSWQEWVTQDCCAWIVCVCMLWVSVRGEETNTQTMDWKWNNIMKTGGQKSSTEQENNYPFPVIPLTPSFMTPLSVYAHLLVLFSCVLHQHDKDWMVHRHRQRFIVLKLYIIVHICQLFLAHFLFLGFSCGTIVRLTCLVFKETYKQLLDGLTAMIFCTEFVVPRGWIQMLVIPRVPSEGQGQTFNVWTNTSRC